MALSLRRAWTAALAAFCAISYVDASSPGRGSLRGDTVPLFRRDGGRPSTVFRGDSRSPEEIRAAGGFAPVTTDYTNPDSFNLAYNVGDQAPAGYPGSAYVPTSSVIAVGFQFAGFDGWIYRIHPTPNFIDVSQSLPSRYAQEHEYAALGGIRWDQVSAYSWAQTPPNPDADPTDWEASCQWTLNPDFDREHYETQGRYTVGVGYPELVSSPSEAVARGIMDQVGSAVYWDSASGFPIPMWNEAGSSPTTPNPPQETGLEECYSGIERVECDRQGISTPSPGHCTFETSLQNQLEHTRWPSIPQTVQGALTGVMPAAAQCAAAFAALSINRHTDRGSQKRSAIAAKRAELDDCQNLAAKMRATPRIHICLNDPMNPPCYDVGAPLEQCLKMVEGGSVSAFQVGTEAGSCSFYKGKNCAGNYFNVQNRTVNLLKEFTEYNDGIGSFRCDCVLEKLHVHVQLRNDLSGGTSNRVFLKIGTNPQNGPILLADGPSRGTEMNRFIPLDKAFTEEGVTIAHIKNAVVQDTLGNGQVGNDQLALHEFTLSAKCAGSSKHIQLTREISGWHRSWSTTMEPRDWIARDSICREIQGDLKFIIEMSGDFSRVRVAIGDSNNKVKIADGPQDGVFVRGSMSLDAAMPVANLKKISVVVASETRTDRQTNVRFNGIHVQARCKGSGQYMYNQVPSPVNDVYQSNLDSDLGWRMQEDTYNADVDVEGWV